MRACAAFATLWIASVGTASGQAIGIANAHALGGLKTIAIESDVSESSAEDIRDCGVDVQMLKAAAAFAMRDSPVAPSTAQPQATYSLHVVVIAHRGGSVRVQLCSVFVEAVLTTAIRGVTYWGSEVRQGDVWRMTYALMGEPRQISAMAAEAVGHITQNFLADWGNDN